MAEEAIIRIIMQSAGGSTSTPGSGSPSVPPSGGTPPGAGSAEQTAEIETKKVIESIHVLGQTVRDAIRPLVNAIPDYSQTLRNVTLPIVDGLHVANAKLSELLGIENQQESTLKDILEAVRSGPQGFRALADAVISCVPLLDTITTHLAQIVLGTNNLIPNTNDFDVSQAIADSKLPQLDFLGMDASVESFTRIGSTLAEVSELLDETAARNFDIVSELNRLPELENTEPPINASSTLFDMPLESTEAANRRNLDISADISKLKEGTATPKMNLEEVVPTAQAAPEVEPEEEVQVLLDTMEGLLVELEDEFKLALDALQEVAPAVEQIVSDIDEMLPEFDTDEGLKEEIPSQVAAELEAPIEKQVEVDETNRQTADLGELADRFEQALDNAVASLKESIDGLSARLAEVLGSFADRITAAGEQWAATHVGGAPQAVGGQSIPSGPVVESEGSSAVISRDEIPHSPNVDIMSELENVKKSSHPKQAAVENPPGYPLTPATPEGGGVGRPVRERERPDPNKIIIRPEILPKQSPPEAEFEPEEEELEVDDTLERLVEEFAGPDTTEASSEIPEQPEEPDLFAESLVDMMEPVEGEVNKEGTTDAAPPGWTTADIANMMSENPKHPKRGWHTTQKNVQEMIERGYLPGDTKMSHITKDMWKDYAQWLFRRGDPPPGFATGGEVPGGPQGTDTVPAWLTPGEYIINKDAAKDHKKELEGINAEHKAEGGEVGGSSGDAASAIAQMYKSVEGAAKQSIHAIQSVVTSIASADSDPSKALGDLGDAASAVGEKVKGLGLIVEIAGESLKAFSVVMQAFDKVVERYGEYSPEIAQAQAIAEVRQTMGDVRRAQELGGEMAKYVMARSDVQQKIEDTKIKLLMLIAPAVTKILEVINLALPDAEDVGKWLDAITTSLAAAIKGGSTTISATIKETFVEKPKDPTDLLTRDRRFEEDASRGGWVPDR